MLCSCVGILGEWSPVVPEPERAWSKPNNEGRGSEKWAKAHRQNECAASSATIASMIPQCVGVGDLAVRGRLQLIAPRRFSRRLARTTPFEDRSREDERRRRPRDDRTCRSYEKGGACYACRPQSCGRNVMALFKQRIKESASPKHGCNSGSLVSNELLTL